MRMIVNILMGLAMIGTAGFAFYIQQDHDLEVTKLDTLRNSVQTIATQSVLRPASDKVDALANGHAKVIEQSWFDVVPVNPFAPKYTPWLEVTDNIRLKHPRHVTFGEERASFWYNPHLGIVRARVPQEISQVATYEFYNKVNRTRLTEASHTAELVSKVAEVETEVEGK